MTPRQEPTNERKKSRRRQGTVLTALLLIGVLVAGNMAYATTISDEPDPYWADREALERDAPVAATVMQLLPTGYKIPDPCTKIDMLLTADWLPEGHHASLVVPENHLALASANTTFGDVHVKGGLLGVEHLLFAGNLTVDAGAVVATSDSQRYRQPTILGIDPDDRGAGSITVHGTPHIQGTLVAGDALTPQPGGLDKMDPGTGLFKVYKGRPGGWGGSILLLGDKEEYTTAGTGMDGGCFQTGQGAPGSEPCLPPVAWAGNGLNLIGGNGGGGGTLYVPLDLNTGSAGSWADVFHGTTIFLGDGGNGGHALLEAAGAAPLSATGGAGGDSGWIITPGYSPTVGDVYPNMGNEPKGGPGGDAEAKPGNGVNPRPPCPSSTEERLQAIQQTVLDPVCAVEDPGETVGMLLEKLPWDVPIPIEDLCGGLGLPGIADVPEVAEAYVHALEIIHAWAMEQVSNVTTGPGFTVDACGGGAGLSGGQPSYWVAPDPLILISGECVPQMCVEAGELAGVPTCFCPMPVPDPLKPSIPQPDLEGCGVPSESAPMSHTVPHLVDEMVAYVEWLIVSGYGCLINQTVGGGMSCNGMAGNDDSDAPTCGTNTGQPWLKPADPGDPGSRKDSMSGRHQRIWLEDALHGDPGHPGDSPSGNAFPATATGGPGGNGFFTGGRGGNAVAEACSGHPGLKGQQAGPGGDVQWEAGNEYCETWHMSYENGKLTWYEDGIMVELSDEYHETFTTKIGALLEAEFGINGTQEANETNNETAPTGPELKKIVTQAWTETQAEVGTSHTTTNQRKYAEGEQTWAVQTATLAYVVCDTSVAFYAAGGNGGDGGDGGNGEDGGDASATGGNGGHGLLYGGPGGHADATAGNGGAGGIRGEAGHGGVGCNDGGFSKGGNAGEDGDSGDPGTGGTPTATGGTGGNLWGPAYQIWPLSALPPLGSAPDGNATTGGGKTPLPTPAMPSGAQDGQASCPPTDGSFDPIYQNGHRS